jgi:ABC-type antimicrobial peptide transport system permease subunit
LAIRLALGAARRRIIGQLLVESVVLALVGPTAGFVLSFWAVRAINAFTLTALGAGAGYVGAFLT